MNRLLGMLVFSGSMVFTSASAVLAQESAEGGQTKKPTKLTDEQKAATTAEAADAGPKNFSIPRPPVALEGNDAVAFWTSGEVVPGEDRFVSVFDGQIYRFKDAENKARFDTKKQTFVPVLGGDSVVAWKDRKKAEQGKLKFYSKFDNRIYLFVNQEEKTAFDAASKDYSDSDLLLQGYSPVALVDQEVRQRGNASEEVIFDGRRMQFTNAEEKNKFLENPGKYYPTLGGLDPVSIVAGQPKFGVSQYCVAYKNRLYCTSSEENRNKFIKSPNKYSDLDVAGAGNCPVTLTEDKRKETGYYGISTVHLGRRYLFTTEEKRKQFIEDPTRFLKDGT